MNSHSYPVGGEPNAEAFFESFLAAPLILVLYLGYKIYSRDWKPFFSARDMDIHTGMRNNLMELRELKNEKKANASASKNIPMKIVRALF